MVGPLVADNPETEWLHVGLMYLNPYRPTFQHLRPSTHTPFVANGKALKATSEYTTSYRAFEDYDFSKAWWCTLYQIWNGLGPVHTLNPAEITVTPLAASTLFWFPRRAPRVPREPAAAPALLAIGDEEIGDDVLFDEPDSDEEFDKLLDGLDDDFAVDDANGGSGLLVLH